MRKLFLIIAVIIPFFAVSVSDAQTTYCNETDFLVTDGGWTVASERGTWSVDVGWYVNDLDGYSTSIEIIYTFPADTTFTNAQMDFEVRWGSTSNVGRSQVIRYYDSSTGSWEIWDDTVRYYSGTRHESLAVTGEITTNQISLTAAAGGDGTGSYARITAFRWSTDGCGTPPPQLTRPIRDSDLGVQGITNNENTSGVFAFSDDVGDMVFSVAAGTVDTIRRAAIADCDKFDPDLDLPFTSGYEFCPISVSLEEGGFEILTSSFSLEPYDFANAIAGEPLGKLRAYYVKINGDDGNVYEYFLDNPYLYIEEGMEINAGCGIGETLRLYRSSLDLGVSFEGDVGVGLSFEYAEQGVTVIVFDGSIDPETQIIPDNGIAPLNASACNKPAGFEGCYGDSNLSYSNQWNQTGNLDFNQGGGVSLGDGASISATYNLNAANMPIFRINAKSYGNSSVTLTLGTSSQTIDINSSSYADYSLEPAAPAPDNGSFYTVRIDNVGSTLEIQYICVSDTLEDADDDPGTPPTPKPPPRPAPDGCIFVNPSFTDREQNWTISNYNVVREGDIIFNDLGVLYQGITLYPADVSTPQTYTITVTAALARYSSYTPDETDTTGTVTLEWDFPHPNAYSTIEAHTRADFDLAYNQLTYQTTFTVATETTSDFAIRVDIANMPTSVYGVSIRDVCLAAGDITDGTPPEEIPGDYDDTVPEDDPGIDAQCELISKPTGSDVGQWINYLWLELNSFFQCDLMVLLNAWFEAFNEAMNTITWFLRWMMIVFSDGIDWLSSDFIYWIGGHLDNIAGGQTTWIEVNEGAESCNNIFCLFTSLFGGIENIFDDIATTIGAVISDVLSPIIDYLGTAILRILDFLIGVGEAVVDLIVYVITTFVDLISAFVQRVIDLVGMIDDLFAWITGSLNTTPQEVPMLPYCNTSPDENIACRLFWSLDNTIFTGPGEAIPGLITSWAAIMLVLWAISSVKNSIMESGRVI